MCFNSCAIKLLDLPFPLILGLLSGLGYIFMWTLQLRYFKEILPHESLSTLLLIRKRILFSSYLRLLFLLMAIVLSALLLAVDMVMFTAGLLLAAIVGLLVNLWFL
jgi:hypothetical protein